MEYDIPLYFHPVISSSFLLLLFFPRLISAIADWMSAILPHMVCLSVNLRCRFETCGSLKIQDAKVPKNRHLGTIAQLCRAISSQLRHVSTIGKKHVKQQYVLQMSPQYGELRPTNGWDRFGSLGHPYEFQRVSRHGSDTAQNSSSGCQPNFVALNRGRHLYSAGRPSRWALAHILVCLFLFTFHIFTSAKEVK